MLPAMKHAAEELRLLGMSPGGGAPSLRQAARSSSAVLNVGGSASEQILQLQAAATKVGCNNLIDVLFVVHVSFMLI